jgi:NADH dehydrogenase
VVVFGGTGFLGRRIVQHLLDHGFAVRIASRHPERGRTLFPAGPSGLEFLRAVVSDDQSVRSAVGEAFGVANAVSLYVERGTQSFHAVHVEAAARVARLAREAGASRLVHVSGIGADPTSASPYIRSRGDGERAVRAAFPGATIVRPGVMFGPDDAFLGPLVALLRAFPVFPMFGSGRTALQPAFVEDVGEAVARILDASATENIYEFGGPRIYTYADLLRTIGGSIGARPLLVPVPFGIWRAIALLAEIVPSPPVTRNQVELMATDNIASSELPGFRSLGIEARGIEAVLAS